MMRNRQRLAGETLLVMRAPIASRILLVTLISLAAVSARAQARDPIVTSDLARVCGGVLMSRISGLTHTTAMPPPTEAAALSQEGQRMCVHGQTRGGIMRLRRALLIMRGGED